MPFFDPSVFLGAFLGFLGGLGVEWIIVWRRRAGLAAAYRQVFATELVRNLRALDNVEESTVRVQQEGFIVSRVATLLPRSDVLKQSSNPEVLTSLTASEREFVVQIGGAIDHILRRYGDWQEGIAPPKSQMLVQTTAAGLVERYAEVVTRNFLSELRMLRTSLVDLLANVSIRGGGGMTSEDGKALAHAVKRLRIGRRGQANYLRAGKSRDVKERGDLDPTKFLVVWQHDWLECPMKVIELKPSRFKGE